jgi:hypothetical protein
VAGIPVARFRSKVWPSIEGYWDADEEGRLINSRQEAERAKQIAWREKSAKGGRAKALANGNHP